MTSASGCPGDDELVALTSGEIIVERCDAVAAHVSTCASCRRRLHDIGETILLYAVHLSDERGSADANALFSRFAPRLHAARQAAIHADAIRTMRRWLPAAAGVLSIVLLAIFMKQTSVALSAEEILARTAISERARPTYARRRIDVRLIPYGSSAHPLSFAVEEGAGSGLSIAGQSSAWPGALPTAVLEQYVDWRDPLNIERLRSWIGRPPHKARHVTRDGPLLIVRVSAPEDTLRVSEVTIRAETYEVVRRTLVFEGGRVEMRALGPVVREARAVATMPALPPSVSDRDVLQRSELEARLLLRTLNLDTTEDVRVTATPHAVRVEGAVRSPATRRVVASRLAPLAHVEVSLDLRRSRRAIDRWRARASEDRGVLDQAPIADLLRLVGQMRRHASGLVALAERYPRAEVELLSPVAQTLLQRLVDEHYRVLRNHLNALRDHLATMGVDLDTPSPTSVGPANWAARAAGTLKHVTELETAVEELLTREDQSLPAGSARLKERLAREFAALGAGLEGSRD